MPEGAVVVGFVAGLVYNASSVLLLKLQVRSGLETANPETVFGVFNKSNIQRGTWCKEVIFFSRRLK